MTELEYVEIEGFKGLEYVEFEPTDINLITGRNNTGKTSFLEAVDLLFTPKRITDFGDNLGHVINNRYETGNLGAETRASDIEISLEHPSPSEARKYFSEVVLEKVEYNLQFNSPPFDDAEETGLKDEIDEIVQRSVEKQLTQESIAELREEILVLSISGSKFPYLLGGDQSKAILKTAWEEVRKNLGQREELDSILVISNEALVGYLDFGSEDVELGLETGKLHLVSPENRGSVTFIESINLAEGIERKGDDREPIKIDDIGDFVKEKGIVDDLKTFTLESLIFEDENGEKEQVPYDFMGDGFKSIVGLLWELMDDDVENEIVLIEEPETHMHPGYVTELVHFLIDLARDEDIQFFITTHDHDFIRDFFTDMPEEKRDYLEDEFSLVKMDDFGADVSTYEEAEHQLKDLHLDLRGI
ncbi:ATP-binding protein [Halorussus salinus]|uniref:ATP-binding protein n=1 Tax=Halorussus salinus TaxID=1364935 RepID=UPI0010930316|nr:ATP-binding protein [Halorussus salinus]